MVDATYRTDDDTRWGTGQDANLTPAQVDINFWNIIQAILALQAASNTSAGIDYFVVNGDQFFVHLTNHSVIGPYTIPQSMWNFRGEWAALTPYAVNDVFNENASLYIVLFAHTSQAVFNSGANDGLGHDYYGLLLSAPTSEIPEFGTTGQVLTKNSDASFDLKWSSLPRNLAFFISGSPLSSELLLQYAVPENMVLPINLEGSEIFAATETTIDQEYILYLNGSTIGNITFVPSSPAVEIDFPSNVSCVPGDILTLVAPSHVDPHLQDISFTIVGLVD